MKTMNQSLAELYNSGKVTIGEAMSFSGNIQELNEMLSRGRTPAWYNGQAGRNKLCQFSSIRAKHWPAHL